MMLIAALLAAPCGRTSATIDNVPAAATGVNRAGAAKAKSDAGERKDVILATTTSTQDSGLLDVLIPAFEK